MCDFGPNTIKKERLERTEGIFWQGTQGGERVMLLVRTEWRQRIIPSTPQCIQNSTLPEYTQQQHKLNNSVQNVNSAEAEKSCFRKIK